MHKERFQYWYFWLQNRIGKFWMGILLAIILLAAVVATGLLVALLKEAGVIKQVATIAGMAGIVLIVGTFISSSLPDDPRKAKDEETTDA